MWSVDCGYKTMKKLDCHTAHVRFQLLFIFTVLSGTRGQAELSDCRVDIDTDWTVRCSCHYTKADVSRVNDINCTWYRQHNQGEVTLLTDGIVTGQRITEGSKTFYSGNCSFSENVSRSQTGTHTFYIDFVPGPVRRAAGHIEIQEPGKPESNCTGRIVFPEGQDRRCSCTNNVTQPGSPPPTVSWGALAPGQPLLLSKIMPSQRGNTMVCETKWGPAGNEIIVETTEITLIILYGPKRVELSNVTQGSRLTGAQDMYDGQRATWSCTAFGDGILSVIIEWAGVQCENRSTNRDCIFTVSRHDDGQTVTCTGKSSRFPDELRTSASVQLNVKYPPSVPPEITGYINNTELTEGNNVTLTCTVRGGNPPVSSVSFSCGTDHHDNPNDTLVNSALHNDSSVSSTVTILNLQTGDDRTTCLCGAEWPYGPASLNYTLTSSVTLNVNGEAELSDCRVDIDTDWTVRGSCHYTKADVSSVNDINCTWYRQHNQGSVSFIADVIVTRELKTEGSKTYYSGNCSFSVTVSTSQTGTHTFYIDFLPGPGRMETGHIEIAGEKINVGAVVGGSVGAVVAVIVTVVVVVVFVKRYLGRSIYAKPGPRLQESNYTDLVINDTVGDTNRASSHENKAANNDYENSGDKRTPGDDVHYQNTGSASQTAELNQYANSEVYAVSGGAQPVYQNTGAVSHTSAEGVYEDTSQM